MMGFFTGLAYWSKSLLKGVAWPTIQLRDEHRIGPTLRWGLHFALLIGILVGLTFLNQLCGLDRLVRAPWQLLRVAWLPTVVFLLYVAGWFVWWLSRIVRSRPKDSEWPDIDATWREATQAVERAGIDLRAVPVYLVLGRPAGTMRSLFDAGHVPLSVPQTPRDPKAPFHVFANSEAVYVACGETTLLGRHSALLQDRLPAAERQTSSTDIDLDAPDATSFSTGDATSSDVTNSLDVTFDGSVEESLQSAVAMLVEEETPQQPTPVPSTPAPHVSLLEQGDELERITSRLRYLCMLVARDRRPYCPVNGLLALVPFAASDDELTAGQTAVLLERDLVTIREMLEIRCPLTTLICDLEKTPGGSELLERFPEDQRRRRLGVSFPVLTRCERGKTPEMIDRGLRWTFERLIPQLVYRLAQIHGMRNSTGNEHTRFNAQLYRLMTELRQRESRFQRMLRRAVSHNQESPWMLTGCYLAATGEDAVRGRGFVGGIFPQLVQVQNHVAWTNEAIKDDRWCHRMAIVGYLGLIAATAAALTLACFL